MALRKLVRRNYGRKLPVIIKYQNLHSFKEVIIILCQSILETRRISHLHGSALFTIPLRSHIINCLKVLNELIDFCFKNVDEKYISVNKQAPDGRSTDNSVTLKRSSLKKALK